jgi:hypothetical protein
MMKKKMCWKMYRPNIKYLPACNREFGIRLFAYHNTLGMLYCKTLFLQFSSCSYQASWCRSSTLGPYLEGTQFESLLGYPDRVFKVFLNISESMLG